MTLPPTTIILMLCTALVSTATINSKPVPLLIWNASQSVPIGLYRVQQADQLTVTDLVIAMPEGPLADFLAERGYLPLHVPLIKRILAVPEQTICRNHLTVMVDGIEMGSARERDHRGRKLPRVCVFEPQCARADKSRKCNIDSHIVRRRPCTRPVPRSSATASAP